MLHRYSKIISTVVVCCFIWTSGGFFTLAQASQLGAKQPAATKEKQQQQTASIEKRFAEITGGLERSLAKAGTDSLSKKSRLKAGEAEIDKLDLEMRGQFVATEQKLTAAKLPPEILERHRKFVQHYDDNLKELKGSLARGAAAKDEAEFTTLLEQTRQQLTKFKDPPRKLAPGTLPSGEPKLIKREPRLKPEEFEQDLKKDKHAWKSAKRIQIAADGPLTGLLLPDDLAETMEVQLTPEIRAKALELENSPLRIYEWVRNTIDFVPTWGSIQGAQLTLQTRQGNAFDTATLLIALLRAAGISSRYVMGTIELPIDQLMNWSGGFTDPLTAANFLASAGIPGKLVYSGGAIQKVQLEHIWVEALIDYFPSRGARHIAGQGDTWIPLDASYKQRGTTGGNDLTTIPPLDSQTFLSQLNGAATSNEAESFTTGVQCSAVSQYQADFRTGVQTFLAARSDATLGTIIGVRNLVVQEFPYLLGALPYHTVVKGTTFAEIPATLRHSITFELINKDRFSPGYSETTLAKSIYLPELADKKVTLGFSPATAADEAVIRSYAPQSHPDGTAIGLGEYPASLPAYLLQVKAELRVNGEVVATALPAGLGGYQQLNIQAHYPNRPDGVQQLDIKAGDYLGIAIGTGAVPKSSLNGSAAALAATGQRIKDGNLSGLSKDDVLGSFLHASALTHLAEIDSLSAVRAQVMGIATVRLPSTAVVMLMLATTYIASIPQSVSIAGPSTAALGYRTVTAAKDGNQDKARRYQLLAGLDLSAQASTLPEYLFSTPEYPVNAVATVKALKTASEQGVPLYRITPANSATTISNLQLDAAVKETITDETATGLSFLAPQHNITSGAWSGSGYEAIDPTSGNSAGNLNGTPNVVQGTPWFSRGILLSLWPTSATPPATLATPIISDTYLASLDATAAGLADLTARPATATGGLLASTLLYERLGEQLGCYLDLTTPAVPTSSCMATYLSLLCTALDAAVITDSNSKPVANAGSDQSVGTGETVQLDASRSTDANNDPLTYQWRIITKPQGSSAALSDATAPAPTFVADMTGVYTLELTVSDGKVISRPATVTIIANPAIVTVPQLSGMGISEADSRLRMTGLTSGSLTPAIDSTVAAGRIAGQSPLARTAINRGSAVNLIVSTGATADTTPPVINLSLDRSPALYPAGASPQLTVNATDNVAVAAVTITLDGTVITAGKSVTAIPTTGFPAGSSHTVQVIASDLSANSATAAITFAILDPADITPPLATINTPARDATITAPVEIRGTVTDSNLHEYTLAYAPAGKNNYTVFARGGQQVNAGILGRLDPTLMQNGLYDITLTAVDANGNTTTTGTRYRLSGDLKVGNFTVAFTDLNIPVSGIPVTVTRSYDSRSKTSGDFGVGWSIDIQSIKIEENAPPGEGWAQSSSGGDWPTYCVNSDGEHSIAVTLPDGKVEEFDQTVTPSCQALTPIQYPQISYTARPGTTSTLQAKNVGQVFYDQNSGIFYDLDSLSPYNPSLYSLTTVDGAVYELDQSFGVRKITDTNGNSLTYSTGGVVHSTGKSLVFDRDSSNRITKITDPSGRSIVYSYDLNGDLQSFTDPAGNVTRYTYNSSHGLIDVIDPLGRRAVRNEYDNSGRLTAHIDANGKRIEYTHDIQGRQEAVKDRNGNLTVFIYDDKGRVLKKTDPLGKSVTYTYDAVGNKLSETDPLGNTTSWTYGGKKNVLTETKSINGQTITTSHTYNSQGKLLTTTDPKGNVTTNTYDTKGNLLTTKDALNNTTTNSYDNNGNLLTTKDALNNTTSYEYDGSGNRTKQTSASGAVTTSTYDVRGNKLTDTDARGNITSYNYDNNGKLLKTTDALGKITSYEYDKAGNKIAETNPLGQITRYAYDSHNRLVTTIYADNTTTATAYDSEGNTASRTDQQGRVTRYSYNADKQLTRTVYADSTYTETGYDAAGRQVSSTDASGKVSTKEYDALGRVTKTTDSENRSIVFEYDVNGNQTKQIDPNGHATNYEYDGANRLTKTTLPGGQSSSTGYDALGRKTSETDAAGNITQFAYDTNGNLANVTDALNQVTSYEYDANNNRTAIVDAKGHRTEFTFDILNRLASKTMPNGGVESYSYDAAGRQTAKTDAKGQTVKFGYDNRNRLTTRTYPDNSTVTFVYSQTGKRSTATDSRGTTTYSYNDRDRLTRTTTPDGKTIGYGYDPTGRTSSINGPAGTVNYTYSDSGRLTTVTDPQGKTTTYSYDNSGNRTGLSYPNGTSTSYTYDTNNRLTQLTHNSINSTSSMNYTLGPIGNRVKIDEASGISRVYTYDNLYRLTKEQATDSTNAQTYSNDFSYDAVGNRQNKTQTPAVVPVVSTDYSYNAADQLVSETGVTYTYDLNGSLVSKTDSGGTTTYSYDYDGRMVKVISPMQTLTYSYDVDGNRVQSSEGSTAVNYLIDNNRSLSQIVAEYTTDGTIIASYTYVDDLISMTRGGQTHWYHFDGLGSTRMLTDSTGAVADKYDYDAFGNLISRTGTTENNFLFTGQRYDANSGFYHLRARYYQPEVGRFTAVDPWKGDPFTPMSLHKYLYCSDDPVNRIDPNGMEDLASFSVASAINTTLTNMASLAYRELYMMAIRGATAWETFTTVLSVVSTAATITAGGAEFLQTATSALLNNTQEIPPGPGPRGVFLEKDVVKVNIGGNYPVIDDFRDRTVTSMKSHVARDVTSLSRSIRADVNALVGIGDRELVGRVNGMRFPIAPSDYDLKQLLVAVPESQVQVIRNPAFRSFLINLEKASGVIIRVVPTRRWRL